MTDCRRPRAGHPRPAGRARGAPRPRDPPGDRPHDPQGRDPRDHGPQRLRQDDPRLRADGPPGVRGQGRRGPLEGLRPAQAVAPTSAPRLGLFLAFQYPTAIPGLSVASFVRSALNAKLQGIDKNPDVDPTDTTRGGVSMLDFRRRMREKMAPPQDGGQLRGAVRQRRLLGRREEAPRDAPDGDAGAGVRDPRRDRLGPRHRRAADRRRGRERAAQPEHGRAADHPLPAAAQLHRARLRARARRRAGS